MSRWYSSADLSWSLASIVDARVGPSKLPLAWFALALPIGVRTSSSESPYAASAVGFTWMRTAGRWPPLMLTRPTPGKLRDLLRDPRVGQVLELRQRQRLRGERQREDRRVRRIDLVVDRRGRQVGRQEIAGRVDRRLHFLLGDVERELEGELQRDHRGAAGARRRHLVQPRHLAELALERRRDRRGHHVGTRARIERHDLDRRIVDLRQRRERQHAVRDDARRAGSRPSAATSRPAAG